MAICRGERTRETTNLCLMMIIIIIHSQYFRWLLFFFDFYDYTELNSIYKNMFFVSGQFLQ